MIVVWAEAEINGITESVTKQVDSSGKVAGATALLVNQLVNAGAKRADITTGFYER